MIRVLFVCLGNICRAPMAEAVMRHLVEQAGLEHEIMVESVGTGDWHVGEPAHCGTKHLSMPDGTSASGNTALVRAATKMMTTSDGSGADQPSTTLTERC